MQQCDDLTVSADPHTAITDFELAVMNAAANFLGPQVEVQGCLKHKYKKKSGFRPGTIVLRQQRRQTLLLYDRRVGVPSSRPSLRRYAIPLLEPTKGEPRHPEFRRYYSNLKFQLCLDISNLSCL